MTIRLSQPVAPGDAALPYRRPPRSHALACERYAAVRRASERLCAGLEPEDMVAQSMPDTSPTKWHLAHTSWFFETFLLLPHADHYEPHHPRYGYLFNSYYNGAGERHPRPQRGVLTRPTLSEVLAYREAVDEAVLRLLAKVEETEQDEALRILEIGLQHEQQHQELMLTDIKHLFSQNHLAPAYRAPLPVSPGQPPSLDWVALEEGIHEIGASSEGFAFDNESPRHRVFLEPCALANRPITNGELLGFVEDGGYQRPDHWLDSAWATLVREEWTHPLYWRRRSDGWAEFTLAGERELALSEPASHVSYVEADAFARWAGARLPSEAEWEVACAGLPVEGNFVESGRLHPAPAAAGSPGLCQAFGDVWEWTHSSYSPYPGYRPLAGTLGEYNGKFMCGQLVLRGGSCASPASHLRASYRNFFHPPDRWQFSGFRLAKEA